MLTPAQRTAFHASRVEVHPCCQLQDIGVAPAALRDAFSSAQGLGRVGFSDPDRRLLDLNVAAAALRALQ